MPLQVLVSAGNDNERRYLMPLLERLCGRIDQALRTTAVPVVLYADRGYDSLALRDQISQHGLTAAISRRRFASSSDGPPGRRRKQRLRDPLGRHRWPIERTNAWLRSWRRVETRWERRSDLYLAMIELVVIVIIIRTLKLY